MVEGWSTQDANLLTCLSFEECTVGGWSTRDVL
jgi:hypothetical protein